MPVIRDSASTERLNSNRRTAMLNQLKAEWKGQTVKDGPVIFLIPLNLPGKNDVLVVWDQWNGVGSEDRTNLILDACDENEREQIVQALGVTYDEAMEQQLLPYAIMPMVRPGEVDEGQIREAMLQKGGIVRPSGNVDLRFPTLRMAQQAHEHLRDQLPQGYWSILQEVARIE